MSTLVSRARIGVAAAALVAAVVPATHAGASPGPLIEGLAGPLGLAIGDDGTVYVSEAFAGRLHAIGKHGAPKVLVDAPGQEIAGVDATGKGTVVYTQTLFDGEPGEEAPPLDAILARVQPNGKTRTLASLQDFEAANNPDESNMYGVVDPSEECLAQVTEVFGGPMGPGIVESHPYAVAILDDGYAVADAAANAIFHVGKNGRVSTAAVLPPIEQELTPEAIAQLAEFGIDVPACEGETFAGDPVPTDIEVGPDGAWYVSTLPGFPEGPGAGAVWRIDPATGAVEQVVGGLSGAVDIAVDSDGSIVVAELFAFRITRIADGVVVGATFAHSPGAVEIADDGTVYAAVGVFDEDAGGSVVTVDI